MLPIRDSHPSFEEGWSRVTGKPCDLVDLNEVGVLVGKLRDRRHLDLLPYGRREEWQDSPEGWPQTPAYSGWESSEAYARYADRS